MKGITCLLMLALCAAFPALVVASVPAWLAAQQAVATPEHEEKALAVVLLSESTTSVLPDGQVRTLERRAIRILRNGAEDWARAYAQFDATGKVTSIKGWSIPASGKPYEVGFRDSIESAQVPGTAGTLVSDARMRVLDIPAANPGSLIGYEVEVVSKPYILQDVWLPQDSVPVARASYELVLPKGWTYKAYWRNHSEVSPISTPDGGWRWNLADIKPIKHESNMPASEVITGGMQVLVFGPTGGPASFHDWNEMGVWFAGLVRDRRTASPEILQAVADATANEPDVWRKVELLARFVQKDVRYVAIHLGIGGYQPHAAREIFQNRYGDCKDKSMLLSVMLEAIGVQSDFMLVNTTRGAVQSATPPGAHFDHAVLAIRIPPNVKSEITSGLPAAVADNSATKYLVFDPTDNLTPFGQLDEQLQANQVLLVNDRGAQLMQLPIATPASNGVDKMVVMRLAEDGALSGEVRETWRGQWASYERGRMLGVEHDAELIKPVENRLAGSVGGFRIDKASVSNRTVIGKPFEWRYSFTAPQYASVAGDLLILRPRVVGLKTENFLETGEERQNPVAFDAPHRDTDTMRIELPKGYEVDSLPDAVNVDIGFASYRSKTRQEGSGLVYERVFELRGLDVPIEHVAELRQLYRTIDQDERAMAVLKKVAAK